MLQQPRAHAGDGFIEHAEQRPLARAVEGFDQFKVAHRRRIEHQVFSRFKVGKPCDVRGIVFLGFADIVQHRACCGDRQIAPAKPEAVKRVHLKMIADQLGGAVVREVPFVQRIQ